MTLLYKRRRTIALFLLGLVTTELFLPQAALALTSGPAQPEMQGFQPAGVSDMVDLSTGDFKYNIPLLDIDGYPVNLNYQSGTGMDDEATWVGLGWNLNVGSINRQLRGLPDDMKGDEVETVHRTKKHITIGGRLRAKLEIGGKDSLVRGEGTFTLGIFNDNYTGIGAEIGVNPGISLGKQGDGALTAGLGVGLMSSTASGVDVSPYMNFSIKNKVDDAMSTTMGLSASLGYNTRGGMKNFTLGTSYGYAALKDAKNTDPKKNNTISDMMDVVGSSISYNTEPVQPTIQFPYTTDYFAASVDLGGSVGIVYLGGGGMGYRTISQPAAPSIKNPAYGFLYAEAGKNVPNAVMDFTREKDVPVVPELPKLALPVALPDLFSYTSQTGSGQFRLFRGGSGIFFDPANENTVNSNNFGFEAGFGSYFHGGGSVYVQNSKTRTGKWKRKNNYLGVGDFQEASDNNPLSQHVYFKEIGQKTVESPSMINAIKKAAPVAVKVSSATSEPSFVNDGTLSPIQKKEREPQRTNISYLTAAECATSGLDKKIKYYDFMGPNTGVSKTEHLMDRVGGYRKAHHFSEMTVTDPAGSRMVYGIPVYNTRQSEYTFAIGAAADGAYSLVSGTRDQVTLAGGLTESQLGQNKGIDNYFHKSETPAYATSYLLSGILSPDYMDISGDGISDDDLGTAIKFNYSYINNFCWRTPYKNATLNKGLMADADDDKASIVYGEKELYYVHSIESKTKIAYFITADRDDALGALDLLSGNKGTVKQKKLVEIRLYAKSDPSRPIKVVKFDYDYSLCPGVPNTVGTSPNNGKLTLKKVWFEYQGNTKGQYFPYKFAYRTSVTKYTGAAVSNAGYATQSTDRWGVYRQNLDNPFFTGLGNDEFPYSVQNLSGTNTDVVPRAGEAASLWHLSHIDLPTGGGIDVGYEADDYAYVQDKKAMVMTPVAYIIDANNTAITQFNLKAAKGIQLNLPWDQGAMTEGTEWFKKNYLNGSPYIYTKFLVTLATGLSNPKSRTTDFVSCFGEIQKVSITSGHKANIIFKDRTESGITLNPVIFAAWQKVKEEYPRYAYPGFDRRLGGDAADQNGNGIIAAIRTAISNLSELRQNFYQRANAKNYSNTVTNASSYARIAKVDGHKLGGGARVKKISISDGWAGGRTYGQAYDYTVMEDGQLISSGVASYEPSVGNDENPLRQPLFYMQRNKGAISNLLDIEEPFGESFFPAPSVVYSRVSVSDLDAAGNAFPAGPTGYTLNEFYTARDFPVQVRSTELQSIQDKPSNNYGIVYTSSVQQLTMSQGYSIELNDMHGKPKAVRTFNQGGAEVASTLTYYNTSSLNGSSMRLRNQVNVVDPETGTVKQNQVIAKDIDFFTDFREQENINDGQSLNLGVDIVPAAGFPLPIPHWPKGNNSEYKLFRSACAVKVSQYYGVVDSVVVRNNGSSIRTANLVYDAKTGQPVVTATRNEFKKDIYSVKIPAYWGYPGMGPGSRNNGMVIANVTTSASGQLDAGEQYLMMGDQFIDGVGKSYWIVPRRQTNQYMDFDIKTVVDRYGNPVIGRSLGRGRVLRGGHNQLEPTMNELVMLTNPVVATENAGEYKLALDNRELTDLRVINASAKTYDENWNAEPPVIQPVPSDAPYDFNIYNAAHTVTAPNVYVITNSYPIYQQNRIGFWQSRENYSMISDLSYGPGSIFSQGKTGVMGVYARFKTERAGTFYVGYGSTAYMHLAFNDMCTPGSGYWYETNVHAENPREWNVRAIQLPKGWVTIKMEIRGNGSQNPNAAGFEIYDNTEAQIRPVDDSQLPQVNVIFSTGNLAKQDNGAMVYVKDNGNTYWQYRWSDLQDTPYSPCILPPVGINPYIYGFKGNWRPYETKVFQQNRVYVNTAAGQGSVLDIKNAGYLSKYYNYYTRPDNGQKYWGLNDQPNLKSWVTANTVTLYDKFGQELQNRDALQRNSAAKFDFNGELPAAVASNAAYREIYANSFEDSGFDPGKPKYLVIEPQNEFTYAKTGQYIQSGVQNTTSHTGRKSISLKTDTLVLNTLVHQVPEKQEKYLDLNGDKQYIKRTKAGTYTNGFQPLPAKSYMVDLWVKDNAPFDTTGQVKLSVNGQLRTLNTKALVEGWKLLEGTFTTPAATVDAQQLKILIYPAAGTEIFIDDLRIHPAVAMMKTYAYDPLTMRLMAELDENAFATLYEYDTQGTLIRVKKETERGVMTVKETRSSQKKTL